MHAPRGPRLHGAPGRDIGPSRGFATQRRRQERREGRVKQCRGRGSSGVFPAGELEGVQPLHCLLLPCFQSARGQDEEALAAPGSRSISTS